MLKHTNLGTKLKYHKLCLSAIIYANPQGFSAKNKSNAMVLILVKQNGHQWIKPDSWTSTNVNLVICSSVKPAIAPTSHPK